MFTLISNIAIFTLNDNNVTISDINKSFCDIYSIEELHNSSNIIRKLTIDKIEVYNQNSYKSSHSSFIVRKIKRAIEMANLSNMSLPDDVINEVLSLPGVERQIITRLLQFSASKYRNDIHNVNRQHVIK